MNKIDEKLERLRVLIKDGLGAENMVEALACLGFEGYDAQSIRSFRLWGDYMPMGDIDAYSEEQRNLHILWDCLDRSPLGVNCAFAVPLRQYIAKKLFKKCGDGFVANEGCRFNYGHRIEVGDNVSWNAGCYIDSKGGVKMGDFAMLTEYVKIFTHSHSEHDHMHRDYNGVEIGEYAKVYTNATILPGVRLGKGAVVATGAIVTKSVDELTLVSGVPARVQRERRFDGEDFAQMRQYMMKEGLFQTGFTDKE